MRPDPACDDCVKLGRRCSGDRRYHRALRWSRRLVAKPEWQAKRRAYLMGQLARDEQAREQRARSSLNLLYDEAERKVRRG